MMTVEELLKPRIKVIADWPFKPFKNIYMVGDVLTDPGGHESVIDQNGRPVFAIEFEKYPHLFKVLEWWQDRKIEDMPEYITWRKKHFHKVERYGMSDINFHAVFIHAGQLRSKPVKFLLPASEADYLAYQSTLTSQTHKK